MSDETKKVGYGVPPEHTKVKPGQKLNPRGRPKGSKNRKTLAERYMKLADEPIEFTQKGNKFREAPIDVVLKKLRKLAVTDEDGKMLKLFLDKYEAMEKLLSAAAPNSYPFSELDKQVMGEMYRRMKLCAGNVDG